MAVRHTTTSERLADWNARGQPADASGLPPGPRLPMALQTLRFWSARQHFLPAAHRRYGDIFTLRIAPVGPIVVLQDPDDIRTVFRGSPEIFHAGEGNSLLRPVVGKRSVLTLDVPEHKTERRRMMPPFHGERIAAVVDMMADATERNMAGWPVGRDFALLERTQALTLDIIVRVVLGVDDSGRAAEVGRALRAVLDLHLRELLMFVWPALRRYPPWSKAIRALDHADALLYDEIDRRRRDSSRAQRPDVLSMLLDGDPDPELVRDELVTLLVAGHETTAVGLAWTFERLLRHPDALAKVRAGLDDARDPYRTAVVKEALRVRPVIYNVARYLRAPVQIGGYELPERLLVMPSIGGVQSDPRIWGTDAAEFRPERWLDGDPAIQQAWIPFGGGTRRCLGAVFAQTEIETVLRTVLRRVELRADREQSERTRMHNITVVPARGARVRLEKTLLRHSSAG